MTLLTGLILTLEFMALISGSHQKYMIGKTSFIITENVNGGRKIPVDIYYPSDSGEINSPVASLPLKKFPVICFNHGYLINPDAYSNIREALVPEGYILIFPRTERGLFPSHKAISKDIGLVFSRMDDLANDTNSIFFERVDTIKCVMGHSMGGGASFAAAGMFPTIRYLVALAPYDTRPSAVEAAQAVTVPVLIFTGSNDCVTPADKYQMPIYESLASASKTMIHIKGGTHCQMAGISSLCRFGERLKSCKAEIDMEEQHRIINRYLVPWLNFYLNGDIAAGRLFEKEIGSDSGIEFERSGPLVREGF
jgi:predicted dienelactone hydrolase